MFLWRGVFWSNRKWDTRVCHRIQSHTCKALTINAFCFLDFMGRVTSAMSAFKYVGNSRYALQSFSSSAFPSGSSATELGSGPTFPEIKMTRVNSKTSWLDFWNATYWNLPSSITRKYLGFNAGFFSAWTARSSAAELEYGWKLYTTKS